MATPLLGWLPPKDRTQVQQDAHARALAGMPRFAVYGNSPTLAKGEKVVLYKAWSDPAVVADVGFVFPRFHQLTGSCVGAGGGQALFTLIAVQRLLAANPTKAILPFWPFGYGRSRFRMGDRSPGEGSMGSTFAESCVQDGVLDALEQGLPKFQDNDGLVITSRLEMDWSDGDSRLVLGYADTAKKYPLGTAAPCNSAADIKAAIINGYPVTFACNNYIGDASVQGSGDDAAVVGYWDGRGGHQQSIHGYWENPTLGPLYLALNNWPGNTYPKDPAGAPICSCWVKEEKVTAAFRLDAEVFAFSHLSWFPTQPAVMNWLI